MAILQLLIDGLFASELAAHAPPPSQRGQGECCDLIVRIAEARVGTRLRPDPTDHIARCSTTTA
jgi:hypothetical protein